MKVTATIQKLTANANPRKALQNQASLASASRPASFQLDRRPTSAKALLRAARMALCLQCFLLLCSLAGVRSLGQNAEAHAASAQTVGGSAHAQYERGRHAEFGLERKPDAPEAAKWYRKAAEQGLAVAQYNLARMCQDGQGIHQSYAEAIAWLRKAAAQDYALAKNRLGVMYERGQGVRKDYVQAYAWYSRAAMDGNITGIANRDKLATRMSRGQIAEAQRRAVAAQVLVASAITAK